MLFCLGKQNLFYTFALSKRESKNPLEKRIVFSSLYKFCEANIRRETRVCIFFIPMSPQPE